MTDRLPPNLLIVGNFTSDTGYAWGTIGEYFAALGELTSSLGGKTVLCYPKVGVVHDCIARSEIVVEEFDFFAGSPLRVFGFLRRHGVRVLYLTDRPILSVRYLVSRFAGVRRIVVHERTSGSRDEPRGIRMWIKKALNRWTFFSVDLAIGVSDFVADRLIRVSCLPESRVLRVHNAVDVNRFSPGEDDLLFRRFSISDDRRVVFAHSRANLYKGIQTLIEAASLVLADADLEDVLFVYCGDGPDLERFRSMVRDNGLEHSFFCPGRCDDIHRLIKSVSVVVVPSLWQEALGLAVVEGMAAGKPVIASKVGGIVEIIEDGTDGFLIEAGDASGLARVLSVVLKDGKLRNRVGTAARRTAVERWNIEDRKETLKQTFQREVLSGIGCTE